MKDVLAGFRRHVRVTVSAAIAVLSAMPIVTCMFGADMTLLHEACCAVMQHECREMAPQSSCCVDESRSLAPTKPTVGRPSASSR
jgi:hypothetical protein